MRWPKNNPSWRGYFDWNSTRENSNRPTSLAWRYDYLMPFWYVHETQTVESKIQNAHIPLRGSFAYRDGGSDYRTMRTLTLLEALNPSWPSKPAQPTLCLRRKRNTIKISRLARQIQTTNPTTRKKRALPHLIHLSMSPPQMCWVNAVHAPSILEAY